MKHYCLPSVALLLVTFQLQAQDGSTREIGLRATNLNSFGIIYKKQLSENIYRRYRLGFGSLSANFINSSTLLGFSAGGAIGKEKRKPLSEKLQAVYGTEFIASVGLNSSSTGTLTIDNGNGNTTTYKGNSIVVTTPSVGIGFVIGAQYNINPKWYVSAELIPSISVSSTFGSGASIYSFQAGFNSSSAGLTGAYRF